MNSYSIGSRLRSQDCIKPLNPKWLDRLIKACAWFWCRHSSILAMAKAKWNDPVGVKDRYGRGNSKWSFYIPSTDKEKKPKVEEQWHTVIASVGFTCAGSFLTYSCTCPDKAKTVAPSGVYAQDQPDYLGRKFRPRIFDINAVTKYKSQFERYSRAFQALDNIEFRGVQNGNEYVYRFYTGRIEKYGRNWSSSSAGLQPDQDCKHIWAAKIYRQDPYTVPVDVPEIPGDYF